MKREKDWEVPTQDDPQGRTRRLPPADIPGIADARLLPDDDFADAWSSIFLPEDAKARLARQAVVNMRLRAEASFDVLPLHGVLLLVGPPGVGKTTLSRGLANRVARAVRGLGAFLFLEIDTHGLTSSALGKSERAVNHLFNFVLTEHAAEGPLIVLIDEVETMATDRAQLSMDANPIDVHRAVDAALVGLDRLARSNPNVLVLATSNFPQAIDPALAGRADFIWSVPLPDAPSREKILRHTIEGLGDAFPDAKRLLVKDDLRQTVEVSEGLDGRRLRKSVASACAMRAEAQADPEQVRIEDLLSAITEMKEGSL